MVFYIISNYRIEQNKIQSGQMTVNSVDDKSVNDSTVACTGVKVSLKKFQKN